MNHRKLIRVGFLSLSLCLVSACGKLDGTWVAGCDAAASDSKRQIVAFDADTYSTKREVFATLDCSGLSVVDNEKKGTFTVGDDSPTTEGARDIDLNVTVPEAKTTFTIFKIEDGKLYLGINSDGHKGELVTERHTVLGGDAHQVYTELD